MSSKGVQIRGIGNGVSSPDSGLSEGSKLAIQRNRKGSPKKRFVAQDWLSSAGSDFDGEYEGSAGEGLHLLSLQSLDRSSTRKLAFLPPAL